MSISKIKNPLKTVVKDMTFTYANYGLWHITNRSEVKTIIKLRDTATRIATNDNEYVRLEKWDSTNSKWVSRSTSDTPFVCSCDVLIGGAHKFCAPRLALRWAA